LTAMGVSLITAPLLLYYLGTDPEGEWIRLGIMALVTTSAAILVTLITPATDDATLKRLYRRVRPFGFLGHAAALNNVGGVVSAEALGTRLSAVAARGISLFTLLVGIGRLLLPAPESSPVISFACIAIGLALIPLWVRMALANDFDV